MHISPRVRRLQNDYQALLALRGDSTIFDFVVTQKNPQELPEGYLLRFYGKGLWRSDASSPVLCREYHEVVLGLGAAYPRMMPRLVWKTPIFHPNVSCAGAVCLGGYGKYWVPSLSLDELCTMLWDMMRYRNFDVASPYNREAAAWASAQRQYVLPIDPRPIRDRVAGYEPRRPVPPVVAAPRNAVPHPSAGRSAVVVASPAETAEADIVFLN